ncbi:FAD-binding oxidoreductase [Deinococcus maricopensis]|uniref:Alkylglycerone-phosphate synthase n=1 Tax=Deinococcus maricopensis (strain DSM 21211 / LMG 22137 / NRRL B-23946 / LB-34) TaxID=709986 RepID=E8U3R5_DEIML|nr:FAD-binding oxidoreductase [Deinococcus maricopensis]ADV68758.1 Alkylglycerone-phosphate synthase [Deinococcus maricopensis DSM 21211]
MKRWNGWGDHATHPPVPDAARTFLHQLLGPGHPPRDATLHEVTARVPASRLPEHPLVQRDADTRVRYARGQSLPDLIALRSGEGLVFPDGVAHPERPEDVQTLLQYAHTHAATVVPYGGGTSVAGHVNPAAGARPVLTISLERLSALLTLDEASRLATFGAGVRGPDLEAALRAQGYTLGHFPQSFEYSTLGGWVATRSSGQQSLRYGRIEAMFAGGTLITPRGPLTLPPYPASAAGPDLRQLVLGSEGRLGILTDVTVRVHPLPDTERFEAAFFPDWASAHDATRALAQSGAPLSMLRLSTPTETHTTLTLAGHPRATRALETYLATRGVRSDKCLLLYGLTGPRDTVQHAAHTAARVIAAHQGVRVYTPLGRAWHKGRFAAPYLRNSLWDAGYAVDTLETATTWDRVDRTLNAVEHALRRGLDAYGERVHAYTHLSHVYPSGCSIYTTYVFRLAEDAAATLRRWSALKGAASEALVREGATISHQHGVGRDHAPYLPAEKGALGMSALHALTRTFDPDGLMNPGVLLEGDHA